VVGSVVFGIIEALDGWAKRNGGDGLAPDLKFVGAVILSFLIPLAAYLALSAQDKAAITFNGIYLAGAVGFGAATLIHYAVGGGSKKANALHEAELHPGVPQELPGSTPKAEPNKEIIVQ
jgi:hypothetical protein